MLLVATAIAAPLPLPVPTGQGAVIDLGVASGAASTGPWATLAPGLALEHHTVRVSASVPLGGALGADGGVAGVGQPELAATWAARTGPIRPAAGLVVGLPLGHGELADTHWRATPWLGADLRAGRAELTLQLGLSTAPGARPVELRSADPRALAHATSAAPVVGDAPPPPPPAPELDPRAPDELLARFAVGPASESGGRVAAIVDLVRSSATDLRAGVLVATPPRKGRVLVGLTAPILAERTSGLRLDAAVQLRP